jgi:alpha-mannosidase
MLRLHEIGGQRGTARMPIPAGWAVRKANLRGQPLGRDLRGGRLEFQPYEIVSLLWERR